VGGLHEVSSLLEDLLAVQVDLAFLTKVFDEIPVFVGFVPSAALFIAATEGEVDRPADLLIEEDIQGSVLDSVIEADAELAEALSAGIAFDDLAEEFLVFLGGCLDDLAFLEFQTDPFNDLSGVGGGELEVNLSLDGVLDRCSEDLPVWHIVLAAGNDVLPPFRREGDIRFLAHDPYRLRFLEYLGEPLVFLCFLLPVAEDGAEEESVHLLGADSGLVGEGLGRDPAEDPAALLDPLLCQFAVGLAVGGDLAGGDGGEFVRVSDGSNSHPYIGPVDCLEVKVGNSNDAFRRGAAELSLSKSGALE